MSAAIREQDIDLPHGIRLALRLAGEPGRPALVFLHGFPEAAFVWDRLMVHFSDPAHGGHFCIAPNLRGYAGSSAPADAQAYRARHLMQDVLALAQAMGCPRLEALVAHDWGGAVAWNLASLHPGLMRRLVILNSPHPATFARELACSPAQQAASSYMNFLARPDAAERLAENDFRRLWALFEGMGASDGPHRWLDEATRQRFRSVWQAGLSGPCAYYAASPLRPPLPHQAQAEIAVPEALQRTPVPTLLLWGLGDTALLPGLLDGIGVHVPDLELHRIADATHWIVHEQPELVADLVARFLARPV